MKLTFEWDEAKDLSNQKKHGVSFEEAKTVFGDPRSITISDELHSDAEDRYIDIGMSAHGRVIVVSYTEREPNFVSSVAARQQRLNGRPMSKRTKVRNEAEMLPEYDFSGGTRGKHYRDYQRGHTVKIHNKDGTTTTQHFTLQEGAVMLAPDVREYFSDSDAVNRALRTLIGLIPQKRRGVTGKE
jgi:uncharacterized DUF497 family protein